MKIDNINKIEDYPVNYDFLPIQVQNSIVEYFEYTMSTARSYYRQFLSAEEPEKARYYALYCQELDNISGAKDAMAVTGVMVEYNWPNHEHKYFLANRQDAIDYEQWIYDDSCPVPKAPTHDIYKYGNW